MGRGVDIWKERGTMQTSSLNAAAPDSASRSIRVVASALQERLLREGAQHEAMTLERFAQFIRSESARWAKVIRERNVRAQ
jgi:hypothetical protein